jgi:hypothetical protein
VNADINAGAGVGIGANADGANKDATADAVAANGTPPSAATAARSSVDSSNTNESRGSRGRGSSGIVRESARRYWHLLQQHERDSSTWPDCRSFLIQHFTSGLDQLGLLSGQVEDGKLFHSLSTLLGLGQALEGEISLAIAAAGRKACMKSVAKLFMPDISASGGGGSRASVLETRKYVCSYEVVKEVEVEGSVEGAASAPSSLSAPTAPLSASAPPLVSSVMNKVVDKVVNKVVNKVVVVCGYYRVPWVSTREERCRRNARRLCALLGEHGIHIYTVYSVCNDYIVGQIRQCLFLGSVW